MNYREEPGGTANSIAREEMEIELEFNQRDGLDQYHFHHRCYVAWEFERGGAFMVELILSEAQLACLKAAVTIGSEESAALGRGVRFGSKLISPEPFSVKCPREIATRLLAVAERFCSDAVPEIRAAIEQERQ